MGVTSERVTRTAAEGVPAVPRPLLHSVELALFQALTTAASVLPERLALAAGASLGWIAGSVLRIRRRAVESHLALAFPQRAVTWRRRVARTSSVHLGREAVATVRFSRMGANEVVARTAMPDFAMFDEALRAGAGVILLTGHLGNWEVGGAAFAARGVPLDAVAKGMANDSVHAGVSEVRRRLGFGLIDMNGAHRAGMRSLGKGRVVAMLADQNAHKAGIFISFFGKLASTVEGPALLALRTGAPIFLAIAYRSPQDGPMRYRVSVERVDFEPIGELDADVRALTEAHCQALERAIRQAPEQYFWQHRRWKKRPDAERRSD